MKLFTDIFLTLSYDAKVDFKKLVEVRRAKMIQEGYEVNHINWELYAKVLEVRHHSMMNC
jgi:hypothetical protein